MLRTSPFVMGIIYSLMGVLFTTLAIENTGDSVWTFSTIVLIIVATFDFSVAIRMFSLHTKIKKLTKKK